jgi:hypothetical protein
MLVCKVDDTSIELLVFSIRAKDKLKFWFLVRRKEKEEG